MRSGSPPSSSAPLSMTAVSSYTGKRRAGSRRRLWTRFANDVKPWNDSFSVAGEGDSPGRPSRISQNIAARASALNSRSQRAPVSSDPVAVPTFTRESSTDFAPWKARTCPRSERWIRIRSSILKRGSNSKDAPAQWKRSSRTFIARPSTASASFSRGRRLRSRMRRVRFRPVAKLSASSSKTTGSDRTRRRVRKTPSRSCGRDDDTKTIAPPLRSIVRTTSPRQTVTRPDRALISSHCRRSASEKVSRLPLSVRATCSPILTRTLAPRPEAVSGAGAEEAGGLLESDELERVLLEDAFAVPFLRHEPVRKLLERKRLRDPVLPVVPDFDLALGLHG